MLQYHFVALLLVLAVDINAGKKLHLFLNDYIMSECQTVNFPYVCFHKILNNELISEVEEIKYNVDYNVIF